MAFAQAFFVFLLVKFLYAIETSAIIIQAITKLMSAPFPFIIGSMCRFWHPLVSCPSDAVCARVPFSFQGSRDQGLASAFATFQVKILISRRGAAHGVSTTKIGSEI